MRIVVIILLVLILLFAAVVVIGGMMLSKEYELERSVVIAAPPAAIHELVGDLERWDDWTPWKENDPSVQVTLGPKSKGVGASQTWTSNEGDGELTITQSDPQTGIEYDMVFLNEGERMSSKGKVTYEIVEGGTKVTWSMGGSIDTAIIGGYFATMMDAMVGPMFEKGLAQLKEAAEIPAMPKTETLPDEKKPEEPAEKPKVPAGAGG